MAESFYKSLHPNRDIVSTRTLLHEAIPLTGTIVSGTYNEGNTAVNIKNYGHGMFQSTYDYPFLSSSANHIFDITVGVSTKSGIYSSVTEQQSKKKNIYNQMAQTLVGHDVTGSILRFDINGDSLNDSGTKMDNVFFLNMSRLLVKDEIKKGTFQLDLGVSSSFNQAGTVFSRGIQITDFSGSDGFFVNSPAGEYGVLYATASHNPPSNPSNILAANQRYAVGLLYYQAGIAVISGSVFNSSGSGGIIDNATGSSAMTSTGGATGFQFVTGSSISGSADGIRNRIKNLQFNNTIELNSTVYFCRVNHNEYNYSTNPTYLSESKIQVKTKTTDTPVSYITTVGLYNDNNELLAVAKLSEPLKKDPTNEFTIRVRLDY